MLVDLKQRGEEQQNKKDLSWDGVVGHKPRQLPETDRTGGGVSGPYVPVGTKRLGEVRSHEFRVKRASHEIHLKKMPVYILIGFVTFAKCFYWFYQG